MKRLLFLFLLLSSTVYGQRLVGSKASPGAGVFYQLLTEDDIPSLNFNKLNSTPTTLGGYGITNAWLTDANTTLSGNRTVTSTGTLLFDVLGLSIDVNAFTGTFGGGFFEFAANVAAIGTDDRIALSADNRIDFNASTIMFEATGTIEQRSATFRTTHANDLSNDWTSESTGSIFRSNLGNSVASNVGFEWLVKGAGAYSFKGNSTQSTRVSGDEDTDNGLNTGTIIWPSSMASDRTWTFPDATGTIALTSDISGYPGPASGTPGDQLRWDVAGTALENFTPFLNPCVSADCFPLWDGSTFQAGSFTANDFNATSNSISIDYTNAQAASSTLKGLLTAADWTSFNAKQAAGLSWLLASGGTLTGANDIVITSSNTLTHTASGQGAISTPTLGFGGYWRNTTAASVGAQQNAPSSVWEGRGWATGSGGSSQIVRLEQRFTPVQGVNNPSGTVRWGIQYNNTGSYAAAMTLAMNEINTSAVLTVGSISTGAMGATGATISGAASIGTTLSVTQGVTTGSLTTGYAAKTALYTLTSTDHTIEVTSGTHTQTLPSAVGITGKTYVITNSGSGTVTVATTSSQTFINVTATPTTRTINQFGCETYQSNGANWLLIATR